MRPLSGAGDRIRRNQSMTREVSEQVFPGGRAAGVDRRVLLLACAAGLALGETQAAMAYVGPGAGIALLGSFLTVFIAMVSAVLALFTWPIRWAWRAIRGKQAYRWAKVKRLVVLGLDGLEPSLTERFMAEGLLPNLAKLRERGSYTLLGTTCPPLSPVAWSSFSTGVNPGKHNIFDFLTRNPRTYQPALSSVFIAPSRRTLTVGKYEIPLGKPEIRGMRKSKPFWCVLGEHGVFSCVLRVPITFPPEKFHGVVLSAMCVPDLRGTQGMFSYYSSGASKEIDKEGGERIAVASRNGQFEAYIQGPDNFLRNDGQTMRIPFRVVPDGRNGRADLILDGQRIRLEVGKYTPWIEIAFKPGLGLKVRGLVRFYLKQLEPAFELYMTPIQIDPDKPAVPISHPAVYSSYLSRLLGKYATAGLAEDTWGLSEDVLDEAAFLEQTYDIHVERERMLFDGLRRTKRGVVVCVVDAPDRIQHMLWRCMEKGHPAARGMDTSKHEHAIRDMYVRMDELVGRVMQHVDDNSVLLVMSDHGFNAFRRGIELNAWLKENGYLTVKEGAGPGHYLSSVDWSGTRAYAIGLAGIYINERGREEHGIVEPGEQTEALKREIIEKLSGLRDPESGDVAISRVYDCNQVYRGPYVRGSFDLIVGYNRGYRVAWEAATGKVTDRVFHDNVKAWSGDHCIDPALIPGVLFCNRKLKTDKAQIIDIAPTALDLFGVAKPAYMEGKSLL